MPPCRLNITSSRDRGVQGEIPQSLAAVLEQADAVQKRQIIQELARQLSPIMEKGILDPVLSHRFADFASCLETHCFSHLLQPQTCT